MGNRSGCVVDRRGYVAAWLSSGEPAFHQAPEGSGVVDRRNGLSAMLHSIIVREMKRFRVVILLAAVPLLGCRAPEPLTQELAERLILAQVFEAEPVYAEVPQRVSWNPESPKDEFDERSVRTLRNLERAGLVTLVVEESRDSATYVATVTSDGFDRLGTVPSARGPAFRGMIAEKKIDGVQNFVRHPTETDVGRAEVLFHYGKPTDLYEMFDTKIDKPLDQPFVSVVSIFRDEGAWRVRVLVSKEPVGAVQ